VKYAPETLKELATRGASLRVDASKLSPETAKELATRASSSGGTVTFFNVGYAPETLKDIATRGKSHVLLDLG